MAGPRFFGGKRRCKNINELSGWISSAIFGWRVSQDVNVMVFLDSLIHKLWADFGGLLSSIMDFAWAEGFLNSRKWPWASPTKQKRCLETKMILLQIRRKRHGRIQISESIEIISESDQIVSESNVEFLNPQFMNPVQFLNRTFFNQDWTTPPLFAGIICKWHSNAKNHQNIVSRVLLQLRTAGLFLPCELKVYPSLGHFRLARLNLSVCNLRFSGRVGAKYCLEESKKMWTKKGFELWSSLIVVVFLDGSPIWGQTNAILYLFSVWSPRKKIFSWVPLARARARAEKLISVYSCARAQRRART